MFAELGKEFYMEISKKIKLNKKYQNMLIIQIYGLILEFIGTFLIIYETIKSPQYRATKTWDENTPKYYDYSYDKIKGVKITPTNFPRQWKKLILWLFIIIFGVSNQIISLII